MPPAVSCGSKFPSLTVFMTFFFTSFFIAGSSLLHSRNMQAPSSGGNNRVAWKCDEWIFPLPVGFYTYIYLLEPPHLAHADLDHLTQHKNALKGWEKSLTSGSSRGPSVRLVIHHSTDKRTIKTYTHIFQCWHSCHEFQLKCFSEYDHHFGSFGGNNHALKRHSRFVKKHYHLILYARNIQP